MTAGIDMSTRIALSWGSEVQSPLFGGGWRAEGAGRRVQGVAAELWLCWPGEEEA